MPELTEYIDLKTAAELLHLNPATLSRAAGKKELTVVKPGKKNLTTETWLQEWLARKTQVAETK